MTRATSDNPSPTHTRVEVLGNIGPNWFASVMGTGIVAIGGATLPAETYFIYGTPPNIGQEALVPARAAALT